MNTTYFKQFLGKNKDFILSFFLILAFIFLYFYSTKKEVVKIVVENQPQNIKKEIINYDILLDQIKAKSFYVYDIKGERMIFAKNEHLQLPLASIAKLMSGLIVLDVLPENTIIKISGEDVSQEGDTGLIVDEEWKLRDLLDFTLITSSNDGMHALASAINYRDNTDNKDIVKLMNEKSKILHLNNTIFLNETGLDVDQTLSGAYSSAYDVSTLFVNIFKHTPSLVLQTKNTYKNFISENNFSHYASNTNISIDNIPNIIASKTGYTDLAGGNLAIVFDAGFSYPVAIVVLGSTVDDRFTDVEKLVNLSLQKLSE